MNRRLTVISGIGLGLALFATPAVADAPPKADVVVIHATNCPTPSVDPGIDKPSLGYTCYKVVGRSTLNLAQGQGSQMALPNGRTFQLTYNGVVPQSSPPRHKLNVAVSKPDGSGYMTLADVNAETGKKLNFGGFNYNGGVLINQVTLR